MASAVWLSLSDWFLSRRRLPYRSGSRVVVVLGDEEVGKSTLIAAWSTVKRKRWHGTLQSCEPRAHELSLNSPLGSFYVKEVDGRKSLDALAFGMSGAVCCVLCVSLANRLSLDSVQKKWVKAARQFCGGGTALVVVGTKSDQRRELEAQTRNMQRDQRNAALRAAGPVPDCLLEQGNGAFTIDMLPEEVLQRIFAMLCFYDRCHVGEVCRAWATILRDSFLWKGIIRGVPVSSKELRKVGQSIGASAVIECTSTKNATALQAMTATVAAVRR